MAVELVTGKPGGGMTIEELCQEYSLVRNDVLAALAYAADLLSEEHVRAVS